MSTEAFLPPASREPVALGPLWLTLAIVLEVTGTMCMRLAGETREAWRFPAYVAYAGSFSLFPWILRDIPLSVAYATWSAVGTLSVAIGGVLMFGDVLDTRRGVAMIVMVGCVVVLNA